MKTIIIRMSDLTYEKQGEIARLYPFDNKPEPTDIVTFVQIYDRKDLDLDIEKARVELELDKPKVH